jgi:hypothetical protein
MSKYFVSHQLLSREEETRLLIQAKAGDKEAISALIIFNQRFDYRTQFFSNRLKETGMGKTSFNK